MVKCLVVKTKDSQPRSWVQSMPYTTGCETITLIETINEVSQKKFR